MTGIVSSHGMLHRLVGQKVEGMRWTCTTSLLCILRNSTPSVPAPTITLETPFHIDLYPSTLRIFQNAWCMPVYRPPSAGFNTWRRVWEVSAETQARRGRGKSRLPSAYRLDT